MEAHETEVGRGPLPQADGDSGGVVVEVGREVAAAALAHLASEAADVTERPALPMTGNDSADLDAVFGELYALRAELKQLRESYQQLHAHHTKLASVLGAMVPMAESILSHFGGK